MPKYFSVDGEQLAKDVYAVMKKHGIDGEFCLHSLVNIANDLVYMSLVPLSVESSTHETRMLAEVFSDLGKLHQHLYSLRR